MTKKIKGGKAAHYLFFAFFGQLRNALQLHYGLSIQNIVQKLHLCILRDFKSETWALHYEQFTFGDLRRIIKE